MTPFYHCKKAELPAAKGRPAIRGTVSIASTGGLLLALPRDVVCSPDLPMDVVFYDPLLGMTRCSCRLTAPVPSGELRIYRCEVLEKLSQEQRREDLKVTLSVPVEVRFEGKIWPATVHNISASGVLLVTSLAAKRGDILSFVFTKTEDPIPLQAKILRVELRPPRRGKLTYGYGCRFVDLSSQHEAQLRSYVFQEERRLYHNDG